MIYTIAAISTIIIVELLIRYKFFLSLPNSRSLHTNEIPTSSGIALNFVVFAYFMGIGEYVMSLIILSICALGVLDDKYQISQLVRLIAQIIIASAVIPYLYPVSILESIIMLFIFVYFFNSYNFMDGINLLAISQAIFILLSVLILGALLDASTTYYPSAFVDNNLIISMIISLSILAYYNKTPASIFLGSSGSYLLGFILLFILLNWLGYFTFLVDYKNSLPVEKQVDGTHYFTLLILYTVFLVDTCYILIKKLLESEDSRLISNHKDWLKIKIKKLTSPHKTHNYQKMITQGMSHHKVVALLMLYNIFWCLPLAIISLYYQDLASFCLVLSCLPYIILCNRNRAGVPDV